LTYTPQPDRLALVQVCFQRGECLRASEALYRESLDGLLHWLLAADQVSADQTTHALDLNYPTTAIVLGKQDGIVAGLEEVMWLLEQHTHIKAQPLVHDGDAIRAGTPILDLRAEAGELLAFERTILNVIGRMSGIATQTQRLVALARVGTAQVAGTRKAPWMLLDKKAIYCGGGLTHRLSLGDGILIKDNHLAILSQQLGGVSIVHAVQEAVRRAVVAPQDAFEIEVETIEQGIAALSTFAVEIKNQLKSPTMVVMLDNFTPENATLFIDQVRTMPIYDRVLFEASGDVTEETVGRWSQTGVDVVSLGALTHSVKNLNVSMALH
jgi:nicotinate-nucleotide pyrophosphorylase (carboxylating)